MTNMTRRKSNPSATAHSLAILAILLAAAPPLPGAAADSIVGTWSAEGRSRIQIVRCGDRYCGAIVWMKQPRNDTRNEDPALRGRPLVGARIMNDFRFDGANSWSGGKLYAVERGKTVDAKLVLVRDDSLEIHVSIGVLNRTVTWTRVPGLDNH